LVSSTVREKQSFITSTPGRILNDDGVVEGQTPQVGSNCPEVTTVSQPAVKSPKKGIKFVGAVAGRFTDDCFIEL